MTDKERREEELEALQAIFGGSFTRRENGCEVSGQPLREHLYYTCLYLLLTVKCFTFVQVHIASAYGPGSPQLTLCVHFPPDYPSVTAPVVELDADGLSNADRQSLLQQLESMFVPGEVHAMSMAWNAHAAGDDCAC